MPCGRFSRATLSSILNADEVVAGPRWLNAMFGTRYKEYYMVILFPSSVP